MRSRWLFLRSKQPVKTILISMACLHVLTTLPLALAANTPSSQIQAQNATNAGVAVNGAVTGSNLNNNQNSLTTGNNANLNLLNPNAVGGNGGASVLMLPRNPLPLSNALLGRSNFGVQFGLQNNPILGNLSGLGGGSQNALGWFLQGGVTIPFGKIPEPLKNDAQAAQLDNMREQNLERRRNIFANVDPGNNNNTSNGTNYSTTVQGKVAGMGAYNYATIPSSKINLPAGLQDATTDLKSAQPKLLALSPADVYSKPLNVGEKIGVVEVGSEYPYLGHTHSGWVKILLPNGSEGWTSTRFEYIKHDYTEIDSLALDPEVVKNMKTAIHLPVDKLSNDLVEKHVH